MTEDSEFPAPCEDLSAFLISGRVKGMLPAEPDNETAVRTPAQGIQDGVDAERIGFRRVFVAERFDLKEAGVLLGAVAGRTSRIGLATGLIGAGSRHPLLQAAMGATMHAAFGERFVLGLGRGAPGFGPAGHMSSHAFADYCTILQRLWAGEVFDYYGPAGSFGRLALADRWEGKAPEIWYGGFGLPRCARTIAETPAITGLVLSAMITPEGVSRAVANVIKACERAGRDPAAVRIVVEVVTAPELDDDEYRALAHARAVTYLQPPAWGHVYEALNDWDGTVISSLRARFAEIRADQTMADNFHRVQLEELARMVPDDWMSDCCAVGSVAACVAKLREFKDAGADEIATYGSTPMQNAAVVGAWRTG